jgi:hypothetical protein
VPGSAPFADVSSVLQAFVLQFVYAGNDYAGEGVGQGGGGEGGKGKGLWVGVCCYVSEGRGIAVHTCVILLVIISRS